MSNIAINGLGRIGRSFMRVLAQRPDSNINIVAINDLGSIEQLAHLLKYDTAFGRFPQEISIKNNQIVINGKPIQILQEKDPHRLPWQQWEVDVVLESTGVFTEGEKARAHLKAGAKKVLISAPATDVDFTLVQGVNHHNYQHNQHNIVSNASCTTNCLAPIAKVLNNAFGILSGFMSTVHAYTQDQNLQDAPHRDMRRARNAAQNIVPTSTGAAKSIGIVIPELDGILDGASIRVPVMTGSMVELTMLLKTSTTIDEINQVMKSASEKMPNIIAYTEDEIVSSDIIQHPASAIFDAKLTKVHQKNLVRIVSWYDNEWGFSNRLLETISQMI